MTLICGCCGTAECLECDENNPAPLTLRVDIGGPYDCNTGGPCRFSIGGEYIMTHPDPAWGNCVWGYYATGCDIGGILGQYFLRAFVGTSGGSMDVLLEILVNYSGIISSAAYRGLVASVAPHNCLSLLATGIVVTKYMSAGVFCIPSFPNTLTVRS